MTQREIDEQFKKWYVPHIGPPRDLRDAYEAGVNMLLDTEQWKNLYSEGLEVGMKMLRDYDKQRIVKCLQWLTEQGWAGSDPVWENGEDEHYTTVTSEELYEIYLKHGSTDNK